MLPFMLSVSVSQSASIIIPVVTLTFSSSWQLCGPSIAEVHANDVRRIHGVSQVQAGGNSNVKMLNVWTEQTWS